jgi:hypothetical protein
MPKRTGDFDAWMLGELSDPVLASSYINAAISDDPDALKVALGNVAKAQPKPSAGPINFFTYEPKQRHYDKGEC